MFHTRKIVTLTAKVNDNSLSGLVRNCHPDDRFSFAILKPLLSIASVCDVTSSSLKSTVCRADAAKLYMDLTKLRQRRQGERQKSNRFNEQNNNSARASRFFVHFFAVPAQLRREMTKF